jgi:hypothetical protein
MGLADGDDTREDASERSTPLPPAARQQALGWPWMVLVAVVAALALMQAFSSFRTGPTAKARETASHAAAPASQARPRAAASAAAPSAAAADPVAPASAAPGVVTRCTQDGKTSFSDQPCAPGAQEQRLVIDPDQNLAEGMPRSKGESAVQGQPRAAGADAASLRKLQCDALAARIRAIDDSAQPAPTAQQQERLAALRRDYRSEMARKGC